MSWDHYAPGNQRGAPRWWEVALWVVLGGLINIGVASTVWSNAAARVLVVVVSVAAWLWILAGLRRPKA